MTWLAPLGFLGLLAIIALILIYIIKPNYQQKFVSSTYVWKLSLKYRKKRIPVNKLRNILIFICQVLVITSCAMILARPVILNEKPEEIPQRIYVIDASASMLTCGNGTIETDGRCRFQDALDEVRIASLKTLSENGKVNIVIASENAYILNHEDFTQENISELTAALEKLGKKDNIYNNIVFGRADIEGAMSIVEELLNTRPTATVTLYTDTEYTSGIKDVYTADGEKKTVDKDAIVDIQLINDTRTEYNIAITGAESIVEGNLYKFNADIVAYGADQIVFVECVAYGANKNNGIGQSFVFDRQQVELTDGNPVRVTFDSNKGDDSGMYSYERARIYITDQNGNLISDAYSYDDEWWFYDGEQPTVKIQYVTTDDAPNFISSALSSLRTQLNKRWNISIKEYKSNGDGEPQYEGYDFYIFNGTRMPSQRPTDGHVLLFSPQSRKIASAFDLSVDGEIMTGQAPLEVDTTLAHPVMNNIHGDNFTINRIMSITTGSGYVPLAYCEGNPVIWIDDETEQKVIVSALRMDYSDTAVLIDFPILIYNIFNYCMPTTLSANYFDIGTTVNLNLRGRDLTVRGSWEDAPVIEKSNNKTEQYKVTRPGTYTVTQVLMSGETKEEYFYSRIISDESNIFKVEDKLEGPVIEVDYTKDNLDLLLWFAVALVSLLFLEWLLQMRENF